MTTEPEPRSSQRTPLLHQLQSLGILHGHIATDKSRVETIEIIYKNITRDLPYDPFFHDSNTVDFTQSLRSQQGDLKDTEYSEAARGRPCGHIFRKGETLYRCRNCGIDDTCVLCVNCYRASDHTGHDVAMSLNGGSGGCCDCGDSEAWQVEMKCAYHYAHSTPESRNQADVPEVIEDQIRGTVADLLDFVIDILTHAKNAGKPPKLDESTSPEIDAQMSSLTGDRYLTEIEAQMITSWSTILWNDEKHDFDEVIDIVKRTCKSTKAFGKQMASRVDRRGRATIYTGHLEEAIRIAEQLGRIRLGVSVRSSRDAFREDMVETAVLFLQDLANMVIMIPNCGQNSDLARRIICEELCRPWLRGVGVARSSMLTRTDQIPMLDSDDDDVEDEHDLENTMTIEEMPEDEEMLDVAGVDALNANDIEDEEEMPEEVWAPTTPITLPTAEDTTDQEETDMDQELPQQWPGHAIITPDGQIALDFRHAALPRADTVRQDTSWYPSTSKRRRYTATRFRPPYWQSSRDRSSTLRLTELFLNDLRLWKRARSALRELYVTTMVAIPYFKREMGITFATAYRDLTESFLFLDRDPDQSIILFSVQIFTVPSIAETLVRDHGFLTTLLAVCYTYYSEKRVGGPGDINVHAHNSHDIYSFRSRRHYHIINDLRYLLCTAAVQRNIPSMRNTICQFLDWIMLFQGQNPQRKKIGQHVEFESDSWVHAFNVTMQIAKHVQIFARTFEHAKRGPGEDQLSWAIAECCERLSCWAAGAHREARPRFEPVEKEGQTGYISELLSFHHPLHWLLVGLAAHLNSSDTLDFVLQGKAEERSFYSYPLKVIHLCWEIRCGLWVRNGQSARAQLFHYTKIDTRDYCIDKDVQFVQLTLAAQGPSLRFGTGSALGWSGDTNTVTPAYLSHFNRHDSIVSEMLDVFQSVPPANYKSNDISCINMQDHMFFFFITLFSERAWMIPHTNAETITRTLIHGLVFGPRTYSEIAKMVNDDHGDEAYFDRIVSDVADFRPPTGLDDTGKFSLKANQFDNVNPYYYQYSLQQVDEANEILSNMSKANKQPDLLPIDHTQWSGIVDFVFCNTLQEWIVDFLQTVEAAHEFDTNFVHSRESLIDKVLHLLLLTLQEELGRRSRGAITMNWGVLELKSTDFFMRRDIAQIPAYLAHQPKLILLRECLNKLYGEQFGTESLTATNLHDDSTREVDIDRERRKTLAKARQAKLLHDMRQSQEAFMNNHTDQVIITAEPSSEETSRSDQTWQFPQDSCLICQVAVSGGSQMYGVLSCIQESILDRATSNNDAQAFHDILSHPLDLNKPSEDTATKTIGAPQNIPPRGNTWRMMNSITTCGHIMHWQCFTGWYGNLVKRNQANASLGRNVPSKTRFQCPLCQAVGNVLLPILGEFVPNKSITVAERDYHQHIDRVNTNDFWSFDELCSARSIGSELKFSSDYSQRVSYLEALASRGTHLSPDVDLHDDWARRCEWPHALRKCLLENSCHPIGDDNYSIRPSMPLVVFKLGILTATIVDIEIALRGTSKLDTCLRPSSVYSSLSEQHLVGLRAQTNLIRSDIAIRLYEAVSTRRYGQPEADIFNPQILDLIKSRRRQIALSLAVPEDDSGTGGSFASKFTPVPLLAEDIFAALVEIGLLNQSPSFDLFALADTLLEAELLKAARGHYIFLSYEDQSVGPDSSLDDIDDLTLERFQSWCQVNFEWQYNQAQLRYLLAYLKRFALAFLRKFAIFAVACLNYSLPLTAADGSDNELDQLTQVLGLRPLSETLSCGTSPSAGLRQGITREWVERADAYVGRGRRCVRSSDPTPFTLIRLPHNLDELFERCLRYKCPTCKTCPNQPAICLFCGTILCFQSQCCWNEELSMGECSVHTGQCARAVGLYLIVKRATLMITKDNIGTFMSAPYLDCHGETDIDLRRGKPQFLNERRYELGVRQLLLHHQVNTWLARKMESYDMGGWQTT